MGNKLLMELALTIAEILNGADEENSNDYFQWEAWKIESNIINLLSKKEYCGLRARSDFAQGIVGWHMSSHQDINCSAEEYFRCVFEYEITNTKHLPKIPTDRLQEIIRSHCLDENKQKEKNISPISLWGIIEQAGKGANQVYYRYWTGKDNEILKEELIRVIETANRHYSEIYRLGLYPPDYIDMIKVSQAKKLNNLIKKAKIKAHQAGEEKWQRYLEEAWQEKPLKKIGEDIFIDYKAFTNHPILKCILSLDWSTIQHISYIEDEDEEDFDPELLEKNDDDSFEKQMEEEVPLLVKKINQSILPAREKELLLAIVERRDTSHLIDDSEDEKALFEYLRNLMYEIWYRN